MAPEQGGEDVTVQHATIMLVKDKTKKIDCQFNPATFQLSKTFEWKPERTIGRDASRMDFLGGKCSDLEVPLLFDSTDTGSDVRGKYAVLATLARINPTNINQTTHKAEPDPVHFSWGKFLSFDAVIISVTEKFLLFKPDGTPLRAEVTIKFKEVATTTAAQNPTSRSEARKTHVVCEGETLDYIAFQEYGDAAQWRHIAETNNLADPKVLHAGQVLQMFPLSS